MIPRRIPEFAFRSLAVDFFRMGMFLLREFGATSI